VWRREDGACAQGYRGQAPSFSRPFEREFRCLVDEQPGNIRVAREEASAVRYCRLRLDVSLPGNYIEAHYVKGGAMRGLLLRIVIVAIGLWVATKLVRGVQITDAWSLVFAALLLGIVNAIVRPVVILLTLPLTILTLGLFLLVINAAMLGLVAWALGDGMTVAGFWSALFGAIIVSITGWLASAFIGDHGRVEVITIERN
jgi:putative membrane protein